MPEGEGAVGVVGRKGIIVYKEYQTVCPIVGIGSLTLVSECVSPLGAKGVGATLPCGRGRGGGDQIRTTGKKVWHSVYYVGGSVLPLCAPVEYTTVHE